MALSKQIGQDPQSNLLWAIYRQLERLGTIIYSRLTTLVNSVQAVDTSVQTVQTELAIHTAVDFTLDFSTILSAAPNDNTTYYFSNLSTPTSTANLRTITMPVNCKIVGYTISTASNGAGTQEPATIFVRVNNTTNNLINDAIVFTTTGGLVSTNHGMNLDINLNVGDTYEIAFLTPAWVTNPASIYITVVLYFKLR